MSYVQNQRLSLQNTENSLTCVGIWTHINPYADLKYEEAEILSRDKLGSTRYHGLCAEAVTSPKNKLATTSMLARSGFTSKQQNTVIMRKRDTEPRWINLGL